MQDRQILKEIVCAVHDLVEPASSRHMMFVVTHCKPFFCARSMQRGESEIGGQLDVGIEKQERMAVSAPAAPWFRPTDGMPPAMTSHSTARGNSSLSQAYHRSSSRQRLTLFVLDIFE